MALKVTVFQRSGMPSMRQAKPLAMPCRRWRGWPSGQSPQPPPACSDCSSERLSYHSRNMWCRLCCPS
jgi:hypothetical protein